MFVVAVVSVVVDVALFVGVAVVVVALVAGVFIMGVAAAVRIGHGH